MIEYKKCSEYNPLNPKADKLGLTYFWRAYDTETDNYYYGKTKAEVMKLIKNQRRK